MLFALVGNQNCGKTTLFNALTGARRKTGNFPGVTVDCKAGALITAPEVLLADLPGIYSLRPYSAEEREALAFLVGEKPDVIINVVDATCALRNFYLTTQLLELSVPTVVALNFSDVLEAEGGRADAALLSARLGVPVVPVSAAKRRGLEALTDAAFAAAAAKERPAHRPLRLPAPVEDCLRTVERLCAKRADAAGFPRRRAAALLLEEWDDGEKTERIGQENRQNGEKIGEKRGASRAEKAAGAAPGPPRLLLSDEEKAHVRAAVSRMEAACGLDRDAALAAARCCAVDELCRGAILPARTPESAPRRRSRRIDAVLTGKYTAFPIFFGVLALIFFLTFGVIGKALSRLLEHAVASLSAAADAGLSALGVHTAVRSLVTDGVLGGVGSVLSFLPVILVLFFFLSLLEDSGYMARVAFFTDKPMQMLGLSGRSFVPLMLGFGCSVPAILATRTLAGRRERILTMLLIPFVSCSAKIPIYAVFCAAFFPDHAAAAIFAVYLFGIAAGICAACILKNVLPGAPSDFFIELPDYRLPTVKSTFLLLWDKASDFLKRAFTVIFMASVTVWLLGSFDPQLRYVTDASRSLLACIGRAISPLLAPAGFGSWKAATALLAGLSAKEAVLSTVGVLRAASPDALSAMFSGSSLSAASFLTFTLLYTPCAASLAAMRREFGSWTATLGVAAGQCAAAWLCAFAVYRLGSLLLLLMW